MVKVANTIYVVMKVVGGRYTLTGVTTDPRRTIIEVMQSAIAAMADQIAAEAHEAEREQAAPEEGDDALRGVRPELLHEAPASSPTCGVHRVPLIWQKGRTGYFWSCHERNGDGSWCTFRPPKAT